MPRIVPKAKVKTIIKSNLDNTWWTKSKNNEIHFSFCSWIQLALLYPNFKKKGIEFISIFSFQAECADCWKPKTKQTFWILVFFFKNCQKSRLENNCGGEKESWEELILEENAVQGVVHQIDLVNELGTVDQGRNRLEI